jgi:hypothetical protein
MDRRTIPILDQRLEAESNPAMEVHVGEVYQAFNANEFSEAKNCAGNARHVIIWLNGRRWEGTLYEEVSTKEHP